MTKVYCSSFKKAVPGRIHLRMRIQWFVGFSDGQLAHIYFIDRYYLSGLVDCRMLPVDQRHRELAAGTRDLMYSDTGFYLSFLLL